MQPVQWKVETWHLWAAFGLLFMVVLIYAPWIYVFNFSSVGVALYYLKLQNENKGRQDITADDSVKLQEQPLTIPSPLEDAQFLALQNENKGRQDITSDDSVKLQERPLTIPNPLEDAQFLANLEAAKRLMERMLPIAPGLQRDMDAIIQRRDDIQRRHQPFIKNFPKWCTRRGMTIRELGNLRTKLDDVCVTANYAKVSGNAVAIAGGLGVMAGVCFPPIAAAAAAFQAMKIVGDVAVPLSTLFENMISEDYICEAKSVFRNDAEYSGPIVGYLGYSRELDRRFEEVFNCSFRTSPSHEIIDKIQKQVEGFGHLVNSIEIGKQIKRGGVFNEKNRQLICDVFDRVEQVKKNFENPRDRLVLKSAAQVGFALLGVGYVEGYASGLTLLALKYLLQQFNLGLTPFQGMAVQCLNEVPNITMHALSLHSALKIAMEGKSEYHAPISELERQLKCELDILSTNFKQLQ